MVVMATWGEFARQRPDLAAGGRALLYQHGVGLAFLATISKDTGPRLHPMCPLLTDEALFAFIIPSPKQQDLRRDGRFAMHSFPCPDNEDAFYVTGRVTVVEDRVLREDLGKQFVHERSQFGAEFPADADALFEFEIERCLLTKTTGHGDPNPQHVVWKPQESS
jgi:hypothetical protein